MKVRVLDGLGGRELFGGLIVQGESYVACKVNVSVQLFSRYGVFHIILGNNVIAGFGSESVCIFMLRGGGLSPWVWGVVC